MRQKTDRRARGEAGDQPEAARANLYEEVTAKIIAELEGGRIPWVQPWGKVGNATPGLPRNAVTGRAYSGVNVLILWGALFEHGHPSQGWLTFKQARDAGGCVEKGEPLTTGQKPPRPELTGPMQTYIDLHRHAAVRAALTGRPKVALRLMVAHAIVGSPLWTVKPEPQTTRNDAIRESVETCRGEADFDEKRRAVLALLDFSPEEPTVTGGNGDDHVMVGVFLRLLDLPDRAVMDVIAVVIGETLAAGSAAVEAVGQEIGVDMARYCQADDAFFELIRDREVLTCIVADVAGPTIASANTGEKAKTLKRIVRDHLDGKDGRRKVERWVPRWMAFPPSAYTTRGGVGTVEKAASVVAARTVDRPDPASPGNVLALPAPAPEPESQPLAA